MIHCRFALSWKYVCLKWFGFGFGFWFCLVPNTNLESSDHRVAEVARTENSAHLQSVASNPVGTTTCSYGYRRQRRYSTLWWGNFGDSGILACPDPEK
mmetsp:Transcript_2646/g.5614  ORF Transcript_2646/g.5614 Transcript_2646/m.5614 type:complete len:98 (+) Transcript_2646:1643-1936(+)